MLRRKVKQEEAKDCQGGAGAVNSDGAVRQTLTEKVMCEHGPVGGDGGRVLRVAGTASAKALRQDHGGCVQVAMRGQTRLE